MSVPILITKLYIPPVCSYQVPRPRLVERLTAGLTRKLVLVSAPAGFGKTNLLAEWAATHHPPMRVAWLSLDEADNDVARFLTYMIAALQRVHGPIGQDAPGAFVDPADSLARNEREWIEIVLTLLINQMCSRNEPAVLVLDDYHLIHAQAVHDALVFLLGHLPEHCHVIISTRSDPPLYLARLRGRGQLFELRQNDLCFTPDETAIFLNDVMRLQIDARAVAALVDRTEGWVAGLQMAAVSMQGCDDIPAFVEAFTGSQHQILDYLVEEVLQRQSESVQTFLLQTSILDRMCGPLCDAVTTGHDCETMLDWLEHANLFVYPLDDQQHWYRYHHLFADLLQHRLQQMYPSNVSDLHRRASAWYESQRHWSAAVDHALAAGEVERATRLMAHAAAPRSVLSTPTISSRPATLLLADAGPGLQTDPLSERELDVLRLLSDDLSSTVIAARLCISVNTVRSHIRSVYDKLNVHSRYEATLRARELHLV